MAFCLGVSGVRSSRAAGVFSKRYGLMSRSFWWKHSIARRSVAEIIRLISTRYVFASWLRQLIYPSISSCVYSLDRDSLERS